MKRTLTAALLAATTCLALPQAASAESYDLQSVFGLNTPSIGPSPKLWAERVERATNGDVTIKVHGAGDFVPPFEVFGAVSSGALPMGFAKMTGRGHSSSAPFEAAERWMRCVLFASTS